ncbi:MAG TPA: periplasmic heavy metal sensor [Thermoanaerobaculia bacterium]|nr:periplasmic heavy metal sensor [Thermoanaerobaculia bacterium]
MKHRIPLVLLALVSFAAVLRAETPAPDPIAEHLYPPELIMRYASDIGLGEPQRTGIKEAVQKAQAKFLDVQWQMQEESEKLVRLLQGKPVDEAAVLAQVDKVLGLEREVKRTQISLLVRLKNLLTEPQERKLAELRKRAGG